MVFQCVYITVDIMAASSAPIRDQLYQEGLALGDFVINEFLKSNELARILNNDAGLVELLESRLKDEVMRFRASAIRMMQDAEFIEVGPAVKVEDDADTGRPAVVYSIPSPAAISKPVIDLLKSMDLSGNPLLSKRARTMRINKAEIGDEMNPVSTIQKSPESEELSNPETTTELSGLFPLSVSEIKIVSRSLFQSSDPFRLIGIIESSEVRNLETPRRKRRKELSNGYFDKDGNYQALIYGGYVHLCSGALEWPFKIADVRFKDFYDD